MITTTIIGVSLAELEEEVPFHEIYQTIFDPSFWGQTLSAINSVVPIRWLSVGENARWNGATAQMHSVLRKIIRQRIAEADKEKSVVNDGGRRDLLTRMVQESNSMDLKWTEDDIIGHVSALPRGSSYRNVRRAAMETNRRQVLTFLAAGHETTSNTISWAIHYLSIHTEVQDCLRAEILAMGDAPNMDFTTIESMRQLDNLYREVSRLRSAGKHTIPYPSSSLPHAPRVNILPVNAK